MLDPLSAYAACKSGIALIEQGIKTGKKLHDLASSVSKWANAESSLDVHAANKGKGGMLSKLGLSSIEEDAMAAYLRKKEIKEKKDQLREIFLLYADNGLQEWENLQAEIGRLRKKKKRTTTSRDGRTRTDQESYWHRCTCCPDIIICGDIRKDIQMVLTKEVKCFKQY